MNSVNTPTQSFSDEIRWYLSIIGRWAWLISLVSVLAAGAAYLVSVNMQAIYQASALVLIEAPTSNSIDYTSVMTSERLAKTFAERMTTRPIIQGVIQRLGLGLEVTELADAIKVSPVRDTQLIEVRVEYPNPQLAADIANTLVAEFSEKNLAQQATRYAASKQNLEDQLAQLDKQIQATSTQLGSLGPETENLLEKDRLQSTLAEYRQAYASLLQSYEQVRMAEAQFTSMVILEEPAAPPREPVSPRIFLNTILAGIMGFLLALGIVFLVEALDDTIRGPDQLARQINLPILGLIIRHKPNVKRPVVAAYPRAPVSEAFRSLRTNIDFASVDRPLRTLLVVSPTPEDGKSTVALNLAAVLAQSERRVILIDADLRRPVIHKRLEIPNQYGLADLFLLPRLTQEDRKLTEVFLQTTEIPNLSILTSGKMPANPAELLATDRMADILRRLTQIADIVVIDSSPVLAVTDAVVLAPQVDGVILIAKSGATKQDACRRAVEQLQRVGARVIGLIINDVQLKHSQYSHYRYSGYYYSKDSESEKYGYKERSNGKYHPDKEKAGFPS